MSSESHRRHRLKLKVFNVPNQLTTMRLILSVFLFGFISGEHYITAMVLFLVAAATDWLDGYWARKYQQITTLGRILDPFADKVIVCGTFIFLAAVPAMAAQPWGLKPWMVVVIVGRELLVTALRSFIEDRGADFSANVSGKLKMVLQCVAAPACLYFLSYADAADAPAWSWWLMVGSVWGTVAITVYSGVIYIFVAVRLIRGDD